MDQILNQADELAEEQPFGLGSPKLSQKAALSDDVDQREVEREIMFKLTEQEIADKGRECAFLDLELAKIRLEFKGVKESWIDKIKALDGQRSEISGIIRAGQEPRRVRCIEAQDFKANAVYYLIKGEIVDQRPLEASERQPGFDMRDRYQPDDNNSMATPSRSFSGGLREVIDQETRTSTKHSSIDGPIY